MCSDVRVQKLNLLDHLISTRNQGRWDGQAQRFRGLEVDHEFERSWLLDVKLTG